MNSRYSHCAGCGRTHRKRDMHPLYTAVSSSMPPKILCYLCPDCFLQLLDGFSMYENIPGRSEDDG